MRIAFLSDTHANLPAVEAALAQAVTRGADRIVVAGDLVGDGPHPAETLDLLRRSSAVVVRGNVDREVLSQGDDRAELELLVQDRGNRRTANRAWTALRLETGQRRWLQGLDQRGTFVVEGHRVLVVHGSPLSDTDYVRPHVTVDDVAVMFEGREEWPRVLVCGHSHEPFVKEVGGILVVNCGSVGRPIDGRPWGSFAVVDFFEDEKPTGRIVRFPYRVDQVVRALRDRGVPGVDPWEYREGRKDREGRGDREERGGRARRERQTV